MAVNVNPINYTTVYLVADPVLLTPIGKPHMRKFRTLEHATMYIQESGARPQVVKMTWKGSYASYDHITLEKPCFRITQ